MTVYLDTSFLIPYYLGEATSESVQAMIRGAPPGAITISTWTLVEFASALARLQRMGLLEGDPHTIAAELEEHARDIYTVLEPTARDYQVARALLLHDPSLGLRGPDALHLAIAKHHNSILYSLDVTLLACAAALSLPATDGGVLQGSVGRQDRNG